MSSDRVLIENLPVIRPKPLSFAISALLASEAAPIRPERIMADMASVLTPDTLVVADASYSSVWIACYLPCLVPGMRFLTPRGIAGLLDRAREQ